MITEILQLFRLRAEVYHNAKVCGDWLIREHEIGQACFHMPTEGGCTLAIPGAEDVILNQGDLVIFPREIPHSMFPATAMQGEQRHLAFADAQDLEGTGMLCGKLTFEHAGSDAFINSLPEYIILRKDAQTAWLEQMRLLLIEESYRDAGSPVLDRLSEIVFIYAIRYYLEKVCPLPGMLALSGSRKLYPALRSMHEQPDKPWTLDDLSKLCNMSRTAFANRFRETSGWTAMQYLTWWRMQLAYSQLKQGESVGNVAEAVGYRSEAAFSRAFQKEFSVSAGRVRRSMKLKVS